MTVPDDPWNPFSVGGRIFKLSVTERDIQILWDITDEPNKVEVTNFHGGAWSIERIAEAVEDYLKRR